MAYKTEPVEAGTLRSDDFIIARGFPQSPAQTVSKHIESWTMKNTETDSSLSILRDLTLPP